MTDLKQLITRAISNGWDVFGLKGNLGFRWEIFVSHRQGLVLDIRCNGDFITRTIADILASLEFWKSIVGEDDICSVCGGELFEVMNSKEPDVACEEGHTNQKIPAYEFYTAKCHQLPENERVAYALEVSV